MFTNPKSLYANHIVLPNNLTYLYKFVCKIFVVLTINLNPVFMFTNLKSSYAKFMSLVSFDACVESCVK